MVLLGALAYWFASFEQRAGSREQPLAVARAAKPAAASREAESAEPSFSLSLSSEKPIARSIERAALYLTARPIRGDDGWFLAQAALSLGGDYPGWAKRIELHPDALRGAQLSGIDTELKLWELRDLPPLDLPALPPPGVDPAGSDGAASTDPLADARRLLELLNLTLRCQKTTSADHAALVHKLSAAATRDLLVGQLWALAISATLECVQEHELRELRADLAARVYGELLDDSRMTDLTAARMAVLCAVGVCSWIPESHFRMLISHQRDTGSWQPDTTGQQRSESHVTSLALYALARRWEQERKL